MVLSTLTTDEIVELGVDDLLTAYESGLANVVGRVGIDTVVDRTELDRDTLTELQKGNSPTLTVAAAAAIRSLEPDEPEAETIQSELLDHIMLGMTSAIVDVETLVANIDVDASPTEIQQRIEGRSPMSLEEYAMIRHFLANR